MDYKFNCKTHGEIIISCSMKDVKDRMICPECGEESERIYSPTASVWKCEGSFGKSN
jgi:ribosomal protein L37AE/L43A